MYALRFAPLLAVLLALCPLSAAGIFTPLLEGVCSAVNFCGKGNCVVSRDSTFGFDCQCNQGWGQTRSAGDQSFKFLPCLVPNCTLNNNCANIPPPPPTNLTGTNSSIVDPCNWTDCRGGSCKKASTFMHTCECDDGYYNLFNITSFPCYKQCEIGLDCAKLGINVMNSSNPSPNAADNSNGTSFIPRLAFSWLIAIVTTLALAWLKYS